MGFFSDLFGSPQSTKSREPEKPSYLKAHVFTAPATSTEVLSVIFAAPKSFRNEEPWRQLKQNYDETIEEGNSPSSPPLVETIYISDLTHEGVTLTAGNRVNTHWTLRLSFEGENPTTGTLLVTPGDTTTTNIKWFGNILSLTTDVQWAVESIGGKIMVWP